MTLSRQQLLHELGITPLWTLRAAPAEVDAASLAVAPAPAPEPASDQLAVTNADAPIQGALPPSALASKDSPLLAVDALDWPELAAQVATCQACPLATQRRQAVFGVGDQQADWLFVGEGPGAEEDARGEPFVGQAGKLLDNMLAALALDRQQRVYIANAVKCRPPNNRTPEAAEMAACRPYLRRQIALLQPKVIVLLGKAAVHSVLGVDKSLASLRGQRFEYAGIPVVVTYHPAYLLRNLPDKAKAWEDLLFARRQLSS